jgi:hypothetical protein
VKREDPTPDNTFILAGAPELTRIFYGVKTSIAFLHYANTIVNKALDDATIMADKRVRVHALQEIHLPASLLDAEGPGKYRQVAPKTGDARYHFWERVKNRIRQR